MRESKIINGKQVHTHLQGQAGVWQVASQLALRGHIPLFPGVDYGYDLKLENGLRLQIKSSRLKFFHRNYPEGVYSVDFRQYRYSAKEKLVKERVASDYSQVADFFVIWGIDENRFWIIPITAGYQRAMWLPKKDGKPWLDPERVKQLQAAGMTHTEIAEEIGTSRTNITRALRRTSDWNDAKSSRRNREFEDAWHLLDANAVAKDLVESVSEVKVQL